MGNARFRPGRLAVLVRLLPVVLLLGLGLQGVTAQGTVPIPLALGENQTGELTEVQPLVIYAIGVTEPRTVNIAVFAITPGLAPTFRVIDPFGIAIDSPSTLGTATAVQASPALGGPGVYQIEVSSANGAFGQFLITLQPGTALEPPQPLILGQPETGTLNAQSDRKAYTFAAAANDVLIISVDSDAPVGGPLVMLRDADTGETLGVSSTRLGGVRFRIPRGVENYLLEITDGDSQTPVPYSVCVGSEANTPACPLPAGQQVVVIPTLTPVPTRALPVVVTVTPTDPPPTLVPLPSTGPCVIASATGSVINIRSGPSTGTDVVSQLVGGTTAQVIGRLPDGSWYQVVVNGVFAWVSGAVVRFGGVCDSVPLVLPSPVPSPTVATATATATATTTATPTATATPNIVQTLNYSLPSNYGEITLVSGFVPDPRMVQITSGGPVDVSYLGGGCSGFATSAPDVSIHYTAGPFPTLRFYFLGDGDTTMVVNGPNANYVCIDDSFSTLNPTIDFNAPLTGRYDIWIGSFEAGASINGTLYITESTANHP